MPSIENKLPLPFPFYDALEKQNRFKNQCEGYSSNELLIVNGCNLLPFQVKSSFTTDPTPATLRLWLNNLSTGTETNITSFLTLTDWDVSTDGDSTWITYYALNEILDTGSCVYDNCVYYLRLDDTLGNVPDFYSEVFRVDNAGTGDGDTYYRIYNTKEERRIAVAGDLRIHK